MKYYFQPKYTNDKINSRDNVLLNYNKHLAQAYKYLQLKDWEKCSFECDFILREFPKNPDALRIKGDIYYYKNLYPQAIWYYQQSIEGYETSDTWVSLARIYNQLQMYNESTACWIKALSKHISSGDERAIRYELGLVYLKLNQKEKAKEQFQRSLEIPPNSPRNINNLQIDINIQILTQTNQ